MDFAWQYIVLSSSTLISNIFSPLALPGVLGLYRRLGPSIVSKMCAYQDMGQQIADIMGHRHIYVGWVHFPYSLLLSMWKKSTGGSMGILQVRCCKCSIQSRIAACWTPSMLYFSFLPACTDSSFVNSIDVLVDLLHVLFVCITNNLEKIPAHFLDRMEVWEVFRYVFEENTMIAELSGVSAGGGEWVEKGGWRAVERVEWWIWGKILRRWVPFVCVRTIYGVLSFGQIFLKGGIEACSWRERTGKTSSFSLNGGFAIELSF